MFRFVLAFACILLASIFIWQINLSFSRDTPAKSQIVTNQSPIKAQVTGGPKYPTLTGRVVDSAGLLSESEKNLLKTKLTAFEETSSDQIVVATISSLNGDNLEQYANGLFRTWELGQREENNGVLLLIAHGDQKLRIEVGYGLEGILTDALSKTIIDQVIVPKFKTGKFGDGIIEGVDMIVAVLSGDTAELEARKKRNPNSNSLDIDWAFWIFILIWGTLFFGPLGLAILAPIFGKKLGKHRYRWLGMEINTKPASTRRRGGSWSGGSSSGWSGGSSGGGFSGGGGSSGGGGASGSW